MRCPFCGFVESKVIDSRATDEAASIRRRRECLACSRRFTTYEVIEKMPLMVIKKDGRREFFDRNKLLNGLLKAFEKRSTPLSVVNELVENVERELRSNVESEVATQQIGEITMKYLRDIDQVAYVRFASVYRQFADVNNFMQELEKLMKSKQ